ncbi:DotA/TraY family protein [Inquilinus sp.]|jgi:conjugal transfer/type IV secretion protein DotA/TraY|uniref:DotA/TraY family protein n=1 Tax=Inquilinus sp. TaxID=1932117 RepID=UPI0037838F4B
MRDETGLFMPHDGPYGVGFLDQISNGAASWLFYGRGSFETQGSILGTIYGTLNLAVLIFAAIVGTLAFLEASAESAATGQIGGRGTSPFRTMARIAGAGVLLFPIKGGMSLIQLVVVWLAASGIGLADYAWTKTADAIVSAGDYTGAPELQLNAPDRETELRFAGVLQQLTAMEVCRQDLDEIAKALNLQSPALSLQTLEGSNSGWTTRMWLVRDTSSPVPPPGSTGRRQANYNQSSALCGSVKIFVNSEMQGDQLNLGNEVFSSTAGDMATRINALAVNATMRAGIDAVEKQLLPKAQAIAGIIRGTQAGTDADIAKIAAEAPVQAAKVFLGQVNGSLTQQMGQFELGRSLQEAARQDGWMFAANWQRMGANISRAIAGLRGALGVEVPRLPSSARDVFGRNGIDRDSTLEKLVRRNDEHQARLAGLKDAWTPRLQGSQQGGSPEANLAQPADGKAILGSVWADLTRTMAGDRAADPMLQYERLGRSLFDVLKVMIAAEWTTSIASSIPGFGGAVSSLDSFLERIIEIVGIAGIALMVVLPVVPILYFVGAIVGWIALVIECMFSLPVLLVTFFAPSRGSTWLDNALPAAKTLFGLLLRPFLIVAGLVVMMAAVRIVAPYVDQVFASMFVLANPNGGFFGFFFFGVLTIFYCIACFAVVLIACRFISGLGDGVMGLIGGYVSSLSRDHMSDHIVAPVNPAGALGRGATAIPANPGTAMRGQSGAAAATKIGGAWRQLRNPSKASGGKPGISG